MPHKILIVDPDPDNVHALRASLREAGFDVIAADNGAAGLAKAKAERPALIVLDLALQQLPWLELSRQLKTGIATSRIPTIILAANATEEDRIGGFEAGADDFVAKPFSHREVILRIKNSLRRTMERQFVQEKMTLGKLVLDRTRHEVTINNRIVFLTVIEFRLLARLMEGCGFVLDRGSLLDEVWAQNSTTLTRTVDTYVTRLRRKLGSLAQYVETIRGVGYRLSEEVISSAKEEAPVPTNLGMKLLFGRRDNSNVILSREKKKRSDLVLA